MSMDRVTFADDFAKALGAPPAPAPAPVDEDPAAGIPLLSLAELRKASGLTNWLIKRAIPSVAIGMLFGASQTFKSFIALDCALHVAHGLPGSGGARARAR